MPGADTENPRFNAGRAVKAHGGVGPIEIDVPGLGWIPPFDSVRSAARGHVAVATDDLIDFFGIDVMMWVVGAAGVDLHQKAGHDVTHVKAVAGGAGLVPAADDNASYRDGR